MKTVNDIRSEFLKFFASKGHERVASSSLVPQNDPTLMFTNSGMVQFKNVFTGVEKRDYSRATTAQKSVRAGGKHNDLENVGYTARHHTFFEMLGNFSFGDYFKEDAIAFAWELVTKNFGMPTDKLLVTVHSSDEEAADIWKKVSGFSDSKIIRIPTNDNFWMMGDTGPCGPCSEIFYDQGDALEGGPPGSPNEDGDRFLEFWNLVFMQFEQEPDGEGGHNRTPLPKPSIDTGMGLERMAALMQGKLSNYDIDLLRTIIEHCSDLTGISADGEQAASHRVIADHLRCSAFLMADGVMPSNEGRGYVLRRIMRRGMRHAHLLGAKDPILYQLYPTLLSMMGQAYPELKRAESLIVETLKNEETRFKRTLDNGLKILEEESGKLSESQQFPGDIAFKLYDTYGFPVDLTQDALRAKNIDVDIEEFESCMARQREQARKNWSGSGDTATEKLWFDLLESTGSTEFLGYVDDKAEGQILAIVKDGKTVETAQKGDEVGIIVNQTPFYAESGGQVADQGTFTTDQAKAKIQDVQKQVGKLFVHEAVIESGTLNVEDSVVMEINVERRDSTRANHSATHLLHEALRQVVGEHVTQKGSLVNAERLRFDISQPTPLTEEQMAAVEQSVNEEIRANTEVITRILPIEEAMESGAMAMFGEKYDEEVRVLFMGKENEKRKRHFSIELCGGTHVKRTGDIGLFKVTSEGALSSGIRRVEAVTGLGALQYLGEQEQRLQEAADILKTGKADVVDRVRALSEDKKKLEQEVADLRRKMVTGGSGQSANDEVKTIGDVRLIAKVLQDFPPKELKSMADDLKQKIGSGVIVLVATGEDKASIVVAVTQDLEKTYSAVDLVKAGAKALGGNGGGGRPDMAQAGGPDASHANDAVSAIEQILEG